MHFGRLSKIALHILVLATALTSCGPYQGLDYGTRGAEGSHTGGSLTGGANLNQQILDIEKKGLYPNRPLSPESQHWGTTYAIDIIRISIALTELKAPKPMCGSDSGTSKSKHPLQIGDIAKRNGGQIDSHKSHKNGLDSDIAYFRCTDENLFNKTNMTPKLIDAQKNLIFFDHIVSMSKIFCTDVLYFFVSDIVYKTLAGEFRTSDIGEKLINREKDVTGPLNEEENHGNHVHVRLKPVTGSCGDWGKLNSILPDKYDEVVGDNVDKLIKEIYDSESSVADLCAMDGTSSMCINQIKHILNQGRVGDLKELADKDEDPIEDKKESKDQPKEKKTKEKKTKEKKTKEKKTKEKKTNTKKIADKNPDDTLDESKDSSEVEFEDLFPGGQNPAPEGTLPPIAKNDSVDQPNDSGFTPIDAKSVPEATQASLPEPDIENPVVDVETIAENDRSNERASTTDADEVPSADEENKSTYPYFYAEDDQLKEGEKHVDAHVLSETGRACLDFKNYFQLIEPGVVYGSNYQMREENGQISNQELQYFKLNENLQEIDLFHQDKAIKVAKIVNLNPDRLIVVKFVAIDSQDWAIIEFATNCDYLQLNQSVPDLPIQNGVLRARVRLASLQACPT